MLALFLALGMHWVKIPDSYRVHKYYENRYGNVIGDYYQARKPTGLTADQPISFVAQCYEGKPEWFDKEAEAKAFVEHCPQF